MNSKPVPKSDPLNGAPKPVSASVRMNGAKDESKKSNPLLEKIQATINQTPPEKWERYGEDLNDTLKYPKARDAWEIVYCITIPSGILAFRSSQPVISQYFGGGYSITPLAEPRYMVELRPRAWDARTLIDPYFRQALEKDKQVQLIADGEIARTVYLQISENLRYFTGEKSREARESIELVMRSILEKTTKSSAEDWKKSDPELHTIQFDNEIDGIAVTVSYSKKDGIDFYHLSFAKDRIVMKGNNAAIAKQIYELIVEKQETAGLEALSKVLDGVGL